MNTIKQLFRSAMRWLNTKEFTAISAAAVCLLCWFMGMKVAAGIALGVFCTRNWDILKDLFNSIKA